MVRFTLLFCFVGSIWQASGQSLPADSSVLESLFHRFFGQVVQRHGQPTQRVVTINNQPTTLVQTSVKDALGLTDTEAESLFAIASDCETKIKALDASSRSLVFEARVNLEGSDKSKSKARGQLDDLSQKRQEIVSKLLHELRSVLGDQRFEAVKTHVLSHAQDPSFFPVATIKQ